ncbi:MAG: hypothetical protein ISS16_07345 [Ignavibacteria bacterium]|nr:hypothetical protein [Ignavibacteria bacterium]
MSDEKYLKVQKVLSEKVEENIKNLLESKHLYQSIQLDLKQMSFDFNEKLFKKLLTATDIINDILSKNWYPNDPANKSTDPFAFQSMQYELHFNMSDIKCFCHQCERIEAMNLKSCENILNRGYYLNHIHKLNNKIIQVFAATYLCQSCKSIPEVFIIRREGTKITLSGRSPIEHIYVPKVIPKEVKKYYEGALLAYQSGQTLAGNFLLRTLIEQFAYLKTKEAKSADNAIDLYMDTLDEDFKNRFPSFRELYSNLSSDIHSAKGSPALFEEVMSELVDHFEARKVFKYN